VCGCSLNPRQARIERAQAHRTCEVLDSQGRLAKPISHTATIMPRLSQVWIEHKRSIDQGNASVGLVNNVGERKPARAERDSVSQSRSFSDFHSHDRSPSYRSCVERNTGGGISRSKLWIEFDRPVEQAQCLAASKGGGDRRRRRSRQEQGGDRQRVLRCLAGASLAEARSLNRRERPTRKVARFDAAASDDVAGAICRLYFSTEVLREGYLCVGSCVSFCASSGVGFNAAPSTTEIVLPRHQLGHRTILAVPLLREGVPVGAI
jgi:hypothetical protein